MVWRANTQPLESAARLEWIICWFCIGHCGRLRRLRHWIRNIGLDLLSLDTLRHHWTASNIRPGAAHWGHGPILDNGQTWSALPRGGRHSVGAECDLRTRWS